MSGLSFRFLSSIVGIFLITGCSHLLHGAGGDTDANLIAMPAKETPSELAARKKLEYRPEVSDNSQQLTGPMRARPMSMHKTVGDYADQLAMLLMDRAFTLKQSDRIAVSSFVRFNNTLREPTVLGNRLAESLIAELQHYGMSIVETKLASQYAITEFGDLTMSRDIRDLDKSLKVDYILTGTLVEKSSGVEVNARIVSVETHAVAAAARLHIPGFVVSNEHFYLHGE